LNTFKSGNNLGVNLVKTQVKLYTLLYLRSGVSAASNSRGKENIIDQLLLNTVALGNFAKNAGFQLTAVTNDATRLNELRVTPSFETIEFNSGLSLPKGIAFEAAHYKIEAFRIIASENCFYCVLLDSDVVINPSHAAQLNLVAANQLPSGYDILDQVIPSQGLNRIMQDIQTLAPECMQMAWFGGEYIGGTPAFFSTLYLKCQEILPRYFEKWRELHHQGDEMIVNAALGSLEASGLRFITVNQLNIVQRYWTGYTRHRQMSFHNIKTQTLFLHLPQEKHRIASFVLRNRETPRRATFLAFLRYIYLAVLVGRLRNAVTGLRCLLLKSS